MKTRVEISAGGVIYRTSEERLEVCLIQPEGASAWQLPKGLIENGEETQEAAKREVAEETGLRGDLVQPLDRIEYWYVWNGEEGPTRVHKWVYFYLLRYTTGETSDHDEEVDDARWVPFDEAQKLLTFENEQRVLERAREALSTEV